MITMYIFEIQNGPGYQVAIDGQQFPVIGFALSEGLTAKSEGKVLPIYLDATGQAKIAEKYDRIEAAK
jgi:hypothetical protein